MHYKPTTNPLKTEVPDALQTHYKPKFPMHYKPTTNPLQTEVSDALQTHYKPKFPCALQTHYKPKFPMHYNPTTNPLQTEVPYALQTHFKPKFHMHYKPTTNPLQTHKDHYNDEVRRNRRWPRNRIARHLKLLYHYLSYSQTVEIVLVEQRSTVRCNCLSLFLQRNHS
jgi:hypothetical protein